MTRSWSVGVSWTWRFARNQDKLGQCLQLADAIINRKEWEAVEPRRQVEIDGRAREVLIWHTGPDSCSLIGLKNEDCQACLRKQSCVQRLVNAIQDTDLSQLLI